MTESERDVPDGLEHLLESVQRAREFDFTGYKRPTLARRIMKRMGQLKCSSFLEYEDYLEVHPDEYAVLFDTVLINVTSFFRDPQAWEFVAEEIVPRIVSGKDPRAPIRVWSAGCASGEEAYTIAMVFCDALGVDDFRSRVKVYGTDIDEPALFQARQARYDAKALESVPEEFRQRYFEANGPAFAFRADLRRSVIFGRHDLLSDAPISRLDLLVCRNTLIYFNAEAQTSVLERFRFALDGGGYLFLGRAETLLTHSTTFRPIKLGLRVFESSSERTQPRTAMRSTSQIEPEWSGAKLRDAAFEAADRAMLVVDIDGTVQAVNAKARALFRIGPAEVGQPLQDLELSYRPLELRSLIDDAYRKDHTLARARVHWSDRRERPAVFDVTVTPLHDRPSGGASGVSIAFDDVTELLRLEAELEQSTHALQTAYEELQSTNEELETMNEELQSTNEELEATNEELQATNEELETLNEELQATNDEFHVVNETLNARGEELDRANAYLGSVLTGINRGVVVVDSDRVVQVWNHWAEDLWGLRADEAEGRRLVNLDIGLDVASVAAIVDIVLERESGSDGQTPSALVPARNRRGRDFMCSVSASPMVANERVIGAIVLMQEHDAAATSR